jgi:hypothetical protein
LICDISIETNPHGPPTIVYWNELNAAHDSVLPALYRLFDQRAVSGFHLRPNVMMIADGNPASTMSSGRDMPMALRRRFCWLEVTSDLPTWERWAINGGIDLRIPAFFNTGDFNKYLNDFDPAKRDRLTYACQASWAKVSKLLSSIDRFERLDDRTLAIAGVVGTEAAAAFSTFLAFQDKLPDVGSILAHPDSASLPERAEMLSLMVAGVAQRVTDKPEKYLGAALTLGQRMVSPGATQVPHCAEYGVFLFRLLLRSRATAAKVKAHPVYPIVLDTIDQQRPQLRDAIIAAGQAIAA